MSKIHPTAIIDASAQIDGSVEVGPFTVIGPKVKIGEGTVIKSHVVIEGNTTIGKNNTIYPFATIGLAPQDLKFRGEESRLIIGNNNTIREHVTIHLGTQDGTMETKIGNNCLFMVGVHIAHDCTVGDFAILANNATIAGHVTLGNHVVIGGLSALHQFVRVGDGAMIGGMSGVESDVIPYGMVMGERASLAGLNLVGMKRRNLAREDINAIRHFFKKTFEEQSEESFADRAKNAAKEFPSRTVEDVIKFITGDTSRSFCQKKKNSC